MQRRTPRSSLAVLVVGLLLGLAACGSEDTKLKVTGMEPEEGDYQGGTYIRIQGNGFVKPEARNAKIYFGSRQGNVVRFASNNEMIVEAPGGKLNEQVDVLIIFEPGGERKIPKGFKFIDKHDDGASVDDLDISKVKK